MAQGGKGGWGNQRFKTSTNRAPRQFGSGLPGEKRALTLEMKVIADVGLLGLPNAGKSTLISVLSAARPRVADYPFTTLYPNLGVVYCGEQRSFVMADIPGLIEGAAEGAGLGIRFLKHLQRTRVLLHLVDIMPPDPSAEPVRDAKAIVGELRKFNADLVKKPRWLVLNKRDLMPDDEAEALRPRHREEAAPHRPVLPDLGRHAAWHARAGRGGDELHRWAAGAGESVFCGGEEGGEGEAEGQGQGEDKGEGQGTRRPVEGKGSATSQARSEAQSCRKAEARRKEVALEGP